MSNVFIVPFRVKAMENSIMPSNVSEAFISCYAQGSSYVEATERALKKLASDGLHVEEILQPIHEMAISDWSEHIKQQWPDYIDNLPAQSEFEGAVLSGQVVYGLFGSYNPE
ncbi:hypothetical protein [Gynuella sunshinyii]|nr:hypothetical protein [Gynuella sunshinyii]